MKKLYLNPNALPDWSNMFSQIVTVEHNGLKFVFLSGQVGVNDKKQLTGKGSLQDQTQQALANLQTVLASAGAEVQDVVKLVIYVVNYRYEHAAMLREELCKVFPDDGLPALSLIGVATLAEERFLIEIDAEAIVQAQN